MSVTDRHLEWKRQRGLAWQAKQESPSIKEEVCVHYDQGWLRRQNERLADGLARMEEPRSIAARLNLLFDVVQKENGQCYTNDEIAALSGEHLTAEEIKKLRERSADRMTTHHLLALCDAFGVASRYWEVWAKPAQLDLQIREAREYRKANEDVPGDELFISELHKFMDDRGLTPEDVQEKTGDTVHARYLEALLNGRARVLEYKKLDVLARMMGFHERVWRERFFERSFLNDLLP